MQIGPDGFFHLTYCTNIHSGEDWEAVRANLERHIPPLRDTLAPDRPFGIGLRLADPAARQLLRGPALGQFRDWLAERDLYVFTLNGFPYGGFHHEAVKDLAYAPDWRTPERLDYTRHLARILAALLPPGLDGGISTVPISYKPWFSSRADLNMALHDASLRLASAVTELVKLSRDTGKFLHLDLEPEPDCLLETAGEVVDFFRNWLLPLGAPRLAARLGVTPDEAECLLCDHVRVCYDVCHFAVAFEDPVSVIDRFEAAGIRVGKVQISAALRVMLPEEEGLRLEAADRLSAFADSRYLHQVVERDAEGQLRRYHDLPEALSLIREPGPREWRIHFHVPIFVDDFRGLHSTQPDILNVLGLLGERRFCRHLEIETYTWAVLPPELRLDIATSIRREYEWVLDRVPGTLSAGGPVREAEPPPAARRA